MGIIIVPASVGLGCGRGEVSVVHAYNKASAQERSAIWPQEVQCWIQLWLSVRSSALPWPSPLSVWYGKERLAPVFLVITGQSGGDVFITTLPHCPRALGYVPHNLIHAHLPGVETLDVSSAAGSLGLPAPGPSLTIMTLGNSFPL